MRDAVITLVKEEHQKNDFGVDSVVSTTRTVYCNLKSVNRADFYAAGQIGLALDHVFITNPVNYGGERILIYDEYRYEIARVYQASPDVLEIYAGHKVGVTSD